MLTQLSSRTFFLPQATQSSCNVAPMRYVPGTLGSPDGRASSRLEQTLLYLTTLTLRRSERAFFGSALASLAELWALLCVYLLHMLAMTPTPAIINVCGGAAQSTIMSVSGALLLISVLPSNSISMVSMYMLINLLLQCACEVSGLSLLVKGERVSYSVFAAHSVFAFPFVTANQFYHSNVPCIIFGFIMLNMLNANLGLITCWSKITFTLKDFYTVHDSNARYHQRLPPAHRVKGQTREGGGI